MLNTVTHRLATLIDETFVYLCFQSALFDWPEAGVASPSASPSTWSVREHEFQKVGADEGLEVGRRFLWVLVLGASEVIRSLIGPYCSE